MIKTGFNGCLMHYTGTHTVGLHSNYFKFKKNLINTSHEYYIDFNAWAQSRICIWLTSQIYFISLILSYTLQICMY